jgi:two-component system chemotaxis response regulator CheB
MLRVENAKLQNRQLDFAALNEVGVSAGIVCPDCGGHLWQMNEGPLRYRCHVGHAMSAHSLLAQQTQVVEAAGWQLLRAIEEDDQLCVQTLQQRLSAEDKLMVESRLTLNREKRQRLQGLLFTNQPAPMPIKLPQGNGNGDASNDDETRSATRIVKP